MGCIAVVHSAALLLLLLLVVLCRSYASCLNSREPQHSTAVRDADIADALLLPLLLPLLQ
jgi:hypothetical protein